MQTATPVAVQLTRSLALTCAQQLLALLRNPNFDLHNDEHCRCADALWHGAVLARQAARP